MITMAISSLEDDFHQSCPQLSIQMQIEQPPQPQPQPPQQQQRHLLINHHSQHHHPLHHQPLNVASLADTIHKRVSKMLHKTRLTRHTKDIQFLQQHDLLPVSPNGLLGAGAFSQVSKVINRRDQKQYACKHLQPKLLHGDPKGFMTAATELAYEAHLLSSLGHHPHIIKVHGWAANGIASFEQGQHDSFFLLLELLEETLDQRIIHKWKKQTPTTLQQKHDRKVEKLKCLYEMASALDYIHAHGVIFRDLKPQNVGFNRHNQVQIFDFGLSRELPELDFNTRFQMSGKVGTIRYMAPEVALYQPYNIECDIYSWSMVSYEVLSEVRPFEGFTPDLYCNLVCRKGMRPTDPGALQQLTLNSGLDGTSSIVQQKQYIPHEWIVLLENAWHVVPQHRISLANIQKQITLFQEKEQLLFERQKLQQHRQQQKQKRLSSSNTTAAGVPPPPPPPPPPLQLVSTDFMSLFDRPDEYVPIRGVIETPTCFRRKKRRGHSRQYLQIQQHTAGSSSNNPCDPNFVRTAPRRRHSSDDIEQYLMQYNVNPEEWLKEEDEAAQLSPQRNTPKRRRSMDGTRFLSQFESSNSCSGSFQHQQQQPRQMQQSSPPFHLSNGKSMAQLRQQSRLVAMQKQLLQQQQQQHQGSMMMHTSFSSLPPSPASLQIPRKGNSFNQSIRSADTETTYWMSCSSDGSTSLFDVGAPSPQSRMKPRIQQQQMNWMSCSSDGSTSLLDMGAPSPQSIVKPKIQQHQMNWMSSSSNGSTTLFDFSSSPQAKIQWKRNQLQQQQQQQQNWMSYSSDGSTTLFETSSSPSVKMQSKRHQYQQQQQQNFMMSSSSDGNTSMLFDITPSPQIKQNPKSQQRKQQHHLQQQQQQFHQSWSYYD